jgi:hypothetical protein
MKKKLNETNVETQLHHHCLGKRPIASHTFGLQVTHISHLPEGIALAGHRDQARQARRQGWERREKKKKKNDKLIKTYIQKHRQTKQNLSSLPSLHTPSDCRGQSVQAAYRQADS